MSPCHVIHDLSVMSQLTRLGNSEGTRVVNKLGISDGEVLGITLRGADRKKLGVKEKSGLVLSVGKVEGR